MSDDRVPDHRDLLDRGVRADPVLPPMTSTTSTPTGDLVDQSDMPAEAPATPATLSLDGERLSGAEVAALVGTDEAARTANLALDAAHGDRGREES